MRNRTSCTHVGPYMVTCGVDTYIKYTLTVEIYFDIRKRNNKRSIKRIFTICTKVVSCVKRPHACVYGQRFNSAKILTFTVFLVIHGST